MYENCAGWSQYYNSPLFIIMEVNLHLLCVISWYILMALDKINIVRCKSTRKLVLTLYLDKTNQSVQTRIYRAVFTWLSKGIGFGFGFGFGFTTPFGWLVYLLWFWFYDSQVKTALYFRQDQPICTNKDIYSLSSIKT